MKKLSIVVPFRNREEHLRQFVPSITEHLKKTSIQFQISIIEQADNKSFNRAKLLNVGFALTQDGSDYFCFHDIDMLPENQNCDYSYTEGVSRLSTYVSQFNYIERPEREIGGGITLINKESFIRVNGYSNDFWGWGAEDNDFGERLEREKISYEKRFGRYRSLQHKNNGIKENGNPSEAAEKNRAVLKNKMQDKESHKKDGLSNLQFILKETINFEDYKLYKVEI